MKWIIVKNFIFWFVPFSLRVFIWKIFKNKIHENSSFFVFVFWPGHFKIFWNLLLRYTRKTQVLWYYPLSATSCYKSIPSFPNYPYVWWLRSCNPLTPWWQKHWRWRAHWWITASTFHGDRPRGCWRRGGRRRSLNHCQGHTLVGCNKKKDICDIDESYILLIFDTIIILT